MTPAEFITPNALDRFAPVRTAKRAAQDIKIGYLFRIAARDINRVGINLAYRRFVNAFRGAVSFARCRTREDVIAAQAALIGEDLEVAGCALKRAAEIVANATGEAVRATLN